MTHENKIRKGNIVFEHRRKILQIGCNLIIPIEGRKMLVVNPEDGQLIFLSYFDVEVMSSYFQLWLELNQI